MEIRILTSNSINLKHNFIVFLKHGIIRKLGIRFNEKVSPIGNGRVNGPQKIKKVQEIGT